jgi:hypothetical protein
MGKGSIEKRERNGRRKRICSGKFGRSLQCEVNY